MSPLSEQLQKRQAAAEIACAEGKGPLYSQGLNTYRVPLALHALNRARLVQALLAGEGGDAPPRGVILLQGGAQPTRHDTDHEPIFRQESYFHWAFGVADAGAYGAISLPDGAATLFVPRHGLGHEIVCGKDPGLEETRARYGVERVLPAADLATCWSMSDPETIAWAEAVGGATLGDFREMHRELGQHPRGAEVVGQILYQARRPAATAR